MAGSLYPAFIRLQYASPYGVHTMTIPMRSWNVDPLNVAPNGLFTDWDGIPRDAFTMIDDFTDLLLPFFLATTTFENFQIFTMTSPTAQAVPVSGGVLNKVGTNVSTSWFKAVEQIYTFRTTVASLAKLVFLDVPTNNNFDRNVTVAPASPLEALLTFYRSTDNAFSARVDGRPDVFLQATANINEKLRKEYRMT